MARTTVSPNGMSALEIDDDSRNEYAKAVDAGHKVDPRAQRIFVAGVVLLVVYAVGLIVPKDLINTALHQSGYAAGYSFSWFVADLGENINGVLAVFAGADPAAGGYASTMIRYVVIALAGAGLALCGAVYQGSFRNALVSPSTLGVMSGASLGMMLWVVFLVDDDGTNVGWLIGAGSADTGSLEYLASSYSLAFLSFIGCILVVGFVLLVMRLGKGGMQNPIMLIITGQVVGGIMGAVSGSIRYYYVATDPFGAKAGLLTDLQIASFFRIFTPIDLVALGVPLILTFALVFKLRRRMGLLAFSEGEARAMGVDVGRMRLVVVGLCNLLTAIIVSFCGTVGFVGFLIPHLARRLVGPDFTYLLPCACVLGAVFVLTAYVLVATLLGNEFETMSGMYISIGGAVVFLITALRGKGGSRGAFN